jgi:transposase-like protein
MARAVDQSLPGVRKGRPPSEIAASHAIIMDAPELNKRCRPFLKPTNKGYRTDETYIKVKGQDKYLCRALDSTGQTIEFLLTAKHDKSAAKSFLVKAI